MIYREQAEAIGEALRAIGSTHEPRAVIEAARAIGKPVPTIQAHVGSYSPSLNDGMLGRGGYEFDRQRIGEFRDFIRELEAHAAARDAQPDSKSKPRKSA